ncbi:MAG: AAA family ATPase [Alphaproteobacteria bacterium]|nr:AAA family ATPase [Alphaproteobacteria bacterium]
MARLTTPADRPPAIPADETDPALRHLVQNPEIATSEAIADLERRALSYLSAGYPLHLRGPAGSGKTSMALRVAEQLKRPIVLLVGDASFDTRRLVGGDEIKRTKRVVVGHLASVEARISALLLAAGWPVLTERQRDGLPCWSVLAPTEAGASPLVQAWLAALTEELAPSGLAVRLTGPWPAYAFARAALQAEVAHV